MFCIIDIFFLYINIKKELSRIYMRYKIWKHGEGNNFSWGFYFNICVINISLCSITYCHKNSIVIVMTFEAKKKKRCNFLWNFKSIKCCYIWFFLFFFFSRKVKAYWENCKYVAMEFCVHVLKDMFFQQIQLVLFKVNTGVNGRITGMHLVHILKSFRNWKIMTKCYFNFLIRKMLVNSKLRFTIIYSSERIFLLI